MNKPLMSIRRTASASLWPQDDLQHFWQARPCCGGREKSALLHFSGFHLCRVGVTASNILKACEIYPPLGDFQMSEHQAISMAPILRGGGNSGANILISHSPPKVCSRRNPLFPFAVKSVSSASLPSWGLCLHIIDSSQNPSAARQTPTVPQTTRTHTCGGLVTRQISKISPAAK